MCIVTVVSLCLMGPSQGQANVSLMQPASAWNFDNGREFPGAKGSLTFDRDAKPGTEAMKLVGDFTGGGLYVQAGRKLDGVDIRELTFWMKNPDGAKITLRLGDGGGQTHQFNLKTEPSEDWQKVSLPIDRFFTKRGTAESVTNVAKYEYWGGAKDGKWHGPAKGIYLLLGGGMKQLKTVWLSNIEVVPAPIEVAGAEVATVIPLDDIAEGEHDWRFSNGPEFKGAKGSLTVAADQPMAGKSCLKLAGDFNGGGAYVAAIRDLTGLGVKEVSAIKLRVRTETGAGIRFQLQDATGQTHQRPRFTVPGDGKWHDITIEPTKHAGGEHWGGVNDGKWHGTPKLISISLAGKLNEKVAEPVIYLADIRVEGTLAVFRQPPAFRVDFEGLDQLPAGWVRVGDVGLDGIGHESKKPLVLSRTLDDIEKPVSIVSPTFAIAPGRWDIGLAAKADLKSPDNSYCGVATFECLDSQGKLIERFTLAEPFGAKDWQAVSKRLDLPTGAALGRFHAEIKKAHGKFWLDQVSASYLAPSPRKDGRIVKLLFQSPRTGNLLLPEDPRQVEVTVDCVKPLRDSQMSLSWEVRDYWGAEQSPLGNVRLEKFEKKGTNYAYRGTLDLKPLALEMGRYYEIHASIVQEGEDPFRNFTSLAILPEAETKKFKPQEVPFTSRNWDNRFPQYFELSDRLGLRTCGVWGGWSSKPPYQAEAPAIDQCVKYDMGILTGTPISTIERGKTDYDEKALREGVRSFLTKYGKYRPLTINLGNEPHGTGDKVLRNVAAYKTVYEEIKKFDPTIHVLATAVEPNEEYFKAGYGQWCDTFDFHVYEGYKNVRRNIEQYQALMKKYGCEKPIWSTELGLNSQGMPRHVVAVEVFKTLTSFFAAGGANASWFAIIYPDADAKSYGSAGDSHNVFDSRYNRFAPRLDAIAYYHIVNGIGIKKFREEKQYEGDISAFLFRDSAKSHLQVLWKKKGRQDVFVPLPGVQKVQIIRVDGSRRELDALGKGVTLTVSDDPLLLQYEADAFALAAKLDAPVATLTAPKSFSRQAANRVSVTSNDSLGQISLVAPLGWTVRQADGAFDVTGPARSAIRELELAVPLVDANGRAIGELQVRGVVE